MERAAGFEVGEIYHLYTRGVEKRIVFEVPSDYERFMMLLLLANQARSIEMRTILRKYQGVPLVNFFEAENVGEQRIHILAFALMPNHIHLLVKEKTPGGISKVMLKLMTAYSMFFNAKHERSGPLFTRPFRSKYVDSDDYFRWLFSYIHLNPLDALQHDWKEKGIADKERSQKFLREYSYSSFFDYFAGSRPESHILTQEILPIDITNWHSADSLFEHFTQFKPDKKTAFAD